MSLLDLNKPIVYTTLGNVNEETLERRVRWEHEPNAYVKCYVEYYADGVCVKRSCDVLGLRVLEIASEQGGAPSTT